MSMSTLGPGGGRFSRDPRTMPVPPNHHASPKGKVMQSERPRVVKTSDTHPSSEKSGEGFFFWFKRPRTEVDTPGSRVHGPDAYKTTVYEELRVPKGFHLQPS